MRRYVVRRSGAAVDGCFDADRFAVVRFLTGLGVLARAGEVEAHVGFLLSLRADVVAMRVGYPDGSGCKLGLTN